MRRTPRNVAAVLAALTLAGVVTTIGSMRAQQPGCLHGQDEAAAQGDRRQQALRLTRQINTLENAARGQARASISR